MNPTENYIKKMHPHPISFLGFYFSGVFFIVLGIALTIVPSAISFVSPFVIIAGLFVLVIGEVSRRAETFYILDGGVERGYQLITSSREFISYEKIQDLQVSQGIMERMFSIGSIDFDTAGSDRVELTFYAVPDPYGLEKIIRDNISKTSVDHHP